MSTICKYSSSKLKEKPILVKSKTSIFTKKMKKLNSVLKGVGKPSLDKRKSEVIKPIIPVLK